MDSKFPFLFSPLKLRAVTLPNRIVSPPHGVHMADFLTGLVSDKQIDYYVERARGGVGLIVTGGTFVHPTSMKCLGYNNLWDDEAIPGLARLAEAVHKYETKIFGQLSHTGRQGTSDASHLPLWAPSPIPCPLNQEMPHEMELEEIKELVEAMRQAARRFKEAGFDGVEIYAGHGYLLCEFLSPYSNKRTDMYGGGFENRFRIVRGVIDAVRAQVGEDFPVGVRISADEFTEGGLTIEDAKEIAKAIEATGKVDYINQSQCNYNTFYTMIPDMSFPLAPFTYLGAQIRQVVDLPVFTVASITDPVLAERILAEGRADAVCLARPLIADPELPLKAKHDRLDDIRTCMMCNEGCIGRIRRGLPVGCVQNPAVGYERDLGIGTMKPAQVKKKVMVIGGGPAGLKAAEVAAERGHDVSLYEKSDCLGGQVVVAAKVQSRESFAQCVTHLVKRVQRLGVKINLETEVTPELVVSLQPDAVVVATGSLPQVVPIHGADQVGVFSAFDAVDSDVCAGRKAVVVDGGEAHMKFLATGLHLAQRGQEVEMISPLAAVGAEIEAFARVPMLKRLGSLKVRMSPCTALKEVRGRAVIVADVWNGQERSIDDIDAIVLAYHHRVNNDLYLSLKGRVQELFLVGDAMAPRKAMDAIREGFMVGRRL